MIQKAGLTAQLALEKLVMLNNGKFVERSTLYVRTILHRFYFYSLRLSLYVVHLRRQFYF